MPKQNGQKDILSILQSLRGLEPLKQLFWSELNYDRINEALSIRGWGDAISRPLVGPPVLFASGGQNNDFHIIYTRLASENLSLTAERPIAMRLLRDHPYALLVFSNEAKDRWHFLNVKYDPETTKRRLFRRITISPEERLRTASERIALLDLVSISPDLFGLSPLNIQNRHDEAFDVEAVTRQFYEEYNEVFDKLRDDLIRQTKNRVWAHDYALQFLNRCMFLYFIQRKGWMNENREFFRSFWESYQKSNQPSDSFVSHWLKVLFFESFNNKYKGGHRHFPENIRAILGIAPYLNGGLFRENDVDQKYPSTITDRHFEQIFRFLERYNFTIAEDSPLDQEVAVDPEMIGKVYESLVNVSEEVDQRGDAGIFFTPRTEIDLMCRLALVNYLTNCLGQHHKSLLYQFVFSLEPEEKADADRAITAAGLWSKLDKALRYITCLDPACGSGSFLVGMLNIIDDLQERINRHLGVQESSYVRRKRIIGQSLYGVDVMEWACHVAELRLWLALILDADFTQTELHDRKEPLLPHFSFNIRCGDSLVQEVGGINLGHSHERQQIPPSMKSRITTLKTEKLKFYNNDPAGRFQTPEQIRQEERNLFNDLIDARRHEFQEAINDLLTKRKSDQTANLIFSPSGTVEPESHRMKLADMDRQKQIEPFKDKLRHLEATHEALKTAKEIPFIWDIAFVEIFSDEKKGFDIIVGNPPYVRQESIADPHIHREAVTTENKKAYKAKLMRSVYQAYPHFFGYSETKDVAVHKIDAKSDLYIYFYFHGLSLLNPKGSFCFITSNSWLDVGYGRDLQEFLLKHAHVKLVLDNQTKRSFASADVNTIIVLLSAPDDRSEDGLNKTACFVMFQVPFEHILSPVIFDEINETQVKRKTKEYRIVPIVQQTLLDDGWEWPEETTEEAKDIYGRNVKGSRYGGNKWGGKYLRAPDIYWTILEKGKGKLVRLGDIADVRFGIKTGANEFFYLEAEEIKKWSIEKDFFKPVLKSPKECKSLCIDISELNHYVFLCRKTKKELKGYAALEYIKWGESQKFHNRPSCRSRSLWYDLGIRELPTLFTGKGPWDRHFYCFYEHGLLNDQQIYGSFTQYNTRSLCAALNASYTAIFLELAGRSNFGEGILWLATYEIGDLPVIKPELINTETEFNALAKRPIMSVFNEMKQPDRIALDNIIFDALGLTQGERDAVYEAVIYLVESRLRKAESIK